VVPILVVLLVVLALLVVVLAVMMRSGFLASPRVEQVQSLSPTEKKNIYIRV
jgi:hypothetical protein